MIRKNLEFLVSLDIPLCIFVTQEYYNSVFLEHPRIKYRIFDNSESWISKEIAAINETIELPENRNESKDTFSFLESGHVKHELLELAIEENPWSSTHFAWIDFNISKIVKNQEGIKEFFHWLDYFMKEEPFLTIPGCWSKLDKDKINDILNTVHWRFCGGFLLGDSRSVRELCELYREVLPLFLREHKKLVWDFNFWAWLETVYEERWKAIHYKGDHNDSIFLCSADHYTRIIDNIIIKKEYDYPVIETYYPTSASYLFFRGEHWINTRYVNYWIYPNGCYLFNNFEGKHLIENKNMLSKLDEKTMEPIFYKEIQENIDYPVNKRISVGLEDVRLYEFNGKIKYIAATTGYSSNEKSRMIVGEYDLESGTICRGQIIQPPNNIDSWCEKNWIPLIEEEKELFIYKWYPMEIGHIDYEKGELVIDYTIPNSFPLFSKVKGSTLFYDILSHKPCEDGLLGVVHISEEYEPRHYYHMLVLLDRETYSVKNYSETFCFEKIGIEYCIGFTPYERDGLETKYTFWISRHDRDPLMIQILCSEIRWLK